MRRKAVRLRGKHSFSETEALKRGMKEKAVEFQQAGAEVYRKL